VIALGTTDDGGMPVIGDTDDQMIGFTPAQRCGLVCSEKRRLKSVSRAERLSIPPPHHGPREVHSLSHGTSPDVPATARLPDEIQSRQESRRTALRWPSGPAGNRQRRSGGRGRNSAFM